MYNNQLTFIFGYLFGFVTACFIIAVFGCINDAKEEREEKEKIKQATEELEKKNN